MELRAYQQDAVNALKNSDATRKLLVLPTGAGKTVVFSHYIKERNAKTLVIAHRREIVQQGIDAISRVNPDKSVGMVMAERKEWDADIMFASIQTLARRSTLKKLPTDIGLVIVDEAHHTPADSYARLLYSMGLMDADSAGHANVVDVTPRFKRGRELVGVTATPRRTDKISLDNCFDELTYSTSIVELIPDYLVDFRAVTVNSGVDISDVDTHLGELSEGQVGDALISADYMKEFPRVIEKHAEGRNHILVFLPNVRTTLEACEHLQMAGIPTGFVTGNTPRAEREQTLKDFGDGKIRVLCNCMILTEGVDIPNIDAIVMARPTKSSTLMQQMVGRGFRKAEGKKDCLLIDLAFERRQADLISVASAGIFGDLTDVHLKNPGMSMMELIEFQKARVPHVVNLMGVLEERKGQIAEDEELTILPDDEIAGATNTAPPYFQNQIPEDMLLLLDTSILRKLCGDINLGEVWKDLVKALRSVNGFWRTQKATVNQCKLLLRCGLDAEMVGELNKADASALIGVLKKYERPTEKQLALLERRFGIAREDAPKTLKETSDLLDSLYHKQAELPMWAQKNEPTAPAPAKREHKRPGPTEKQLALLERRFGIAREDAPKTVQEASRLLDKLFYKTHVHHDAHGQRGV